MRATCSSLGNVGNPGWFGFLVNPLGVSLLLIASICVYGAFSSPFPSAVGTSEIFIGVAFVSIGLVLFPGLCSIVRVGGIGWPFVAFLYLLIVPLFTGYRQYSYVDLSRDIIPVFYMFMPVLFVSLWESLAESRFLTSVLPSFVGIVGVLFSVRFFWVGGFDISQVGKIFIVSATDLERNVTYFPYDPSVLFASVWFLLNAINKFKSGEWVPSLINVCLSLAAVASLVGLVQRAPLALIFLGALLFVAILFKTSIRAGTMGLVFLSILFIVFSPQLFGLLGLMVSKTASVGVNGKIAEFAAVNSSLLDPVVSKTASVGVSGKVAEFVAVNSSLLGSESSVLFRQLFGLGWGGTFFNPVVQSDTRFTHSILSFFYLKAGLIGLLVFLSYFGWLFKGFVAALYRALRFDCDQLPLVLSVGTVFPICFLQNTYKTLIFGLVLSMIFVLSKGKGYSVAPVPFK